MTEQLEEEEESKRALEKQLSDTRLQLSEYKKKADENEELVARLEDLKKRNMKELEELVHKLDEVSTFLFSRKEPPSLGHFDSPEC